ncbi:DUF488 family protein [Nocardioidaceae bacterium SCSIO 66511]|nr:DUF488 family protein [Nocardioidaceae bacterium SCSIO 66511]
MAGVASIQVKRVYEEAADSDGARILVDRLWPRGVSKEKAGLDAWHQDVAPSPELRMWYGHDPARFDEFADRYRAELNGRTAAIDGMLGEIKGETLTLITATKDVEHSGAVVLAEVLRDRV